MALIDVGDGVRLSVIEAGSGGPPFLFVHGLACDHTSWSPQFDDLSRDHRCVAVDLRGRGESDATPPYDTAQQADDLAAVSHALNLGPAVVVGHSLGGTAALRLGQRHPDAVLATVLGDSPVREQGLGAGRMVESIRSGGAAGLAPLVESFWSEDTPDQVKEYARAVMLGCPAEVTAGMLEDAPTDMLELVRIADRKPFMALWAEKPLGDPAWLRVTCPFLRQEPIAGTGHFFQLEQPAITNALLRAFLDDIARDPRLQREKQAARHRR